MTPGGGSLDFGNPGDVLLLAVVLSLVLIVHVARAKGSSTRQVVRAPTARSAAIGTESITSRDPGFSLPLFTDLARLVYTRARETGGGDAVAAYVAPNVRTKLAATSKVTDVIIGATALANVRITASEIQLDVRFETNMTVDGGQFRVVDVWTFARDAKALSPGPDKMRTLSCIQCGSAVGTTPDGACKNCDAVLDDGRLQWRVVAIRPIEREPVQPIQTGGGEEAGTNAPLVQAGDLGVRMRELSARDAQFSWPAFRAKVEDTFIHIQDAWSSTKIEQARAYETDFLYQQHHYWITRYRREGIRNRLSNVTISDVVPAKITFDRYIESITVRIYASMCDWTERSDGTVVSGSAKQPRRFSEYWTFVRTVGARTKAGALDQCPSCAAPLDRITETGVCGYCDATVTGGDYDWVLAAIDQDEAWHG